MNQKTDSNIKLPFDNTDLISHQWFQQLKTGIKFYFIDKSDFTIRRMTDSDLVDVVCLENEIFSDPWPLSGFLTESFDEHKYLNIVGIKENKIIAYAVSVIVVEELHIHNFAVTPQNRRKNYGATLLWLILKIAIINKISICHLEVRKSNLPAIFLYQKFGFKMVGTRKKYYIKENEDALLMSKKI